MGGGQPDRVSLRSGDAALRARPIVDTQRETRGKWQRVSWDTSLKAWHVRPESVRDTYHPIQLIMVVIGGPKFKGFPISIRQKQSCAYTESLLRLLESLRVGPRLAHAIFTAPVTRVNDFLLSFYTIFLRANGLSFVPTGGFGAAASMSQSNLYVTAEVLNPLNPFWGRAY